MSPVAQDDGYWNATAQPPAFPKLADEGRVDVAIVGGGIVGISTARRLKDKGLTVAVVEARRVGRQVTGKSTAKVTSQHALRYQTLEKKFGRAKALKYADAQEAAIDDIKRLITSYEINCDLECKDAYVYTCQDRHVRQIEREVEVARSLGLPATSVQETGLPFEVRAAIRYDGQAQFHPTKYVAGLAQTLPGKGATFLRKAASWTGILVASQAKLGAYLQSRW
jgi:glycine/D-amino acid oxidase-like deaminating enzyme